MNTDSHHGKLYDLIIVYIGACCSIPILECIIITPNVSCKISSMNNNIVDTKIDKQTILIVKKKKSKLLFQIRLNRTVCSQRSALPPPSVGCQGGQLINTDS